MARRFELRQLEGKVGKARNIYSKWFYGYYLRNYSKDFFSFVKRKISIVIYHSIWSTDKGKQEYILEENYLSVEKFNDQM